MSRLTSNRCIISLLAEEIEKRPDQRFHQILQDLNIVELNKDKFYEESDKTLNELITVIKVCDVKRHEIEKQKRIAKLEFIRTRRKKTDDNRQRSCPNV